MPQNYHAPTLVELGSVHDLTLGSGPGFPDTCDFAVGSVVGTDPCSGTPDPVSGTPKP